MTAKGVELLLARLIEFKRVFVYDFNIEKFIQFCESNDVHPCGGAIDCDVNGNYVGKYFYID